MGGLSPSCFHQILVVHDGGGASAVEMTAQSGEEYWEAKPLLARHAVGNLCEFDGVENSLQEERVSIEREAQ